MSTANHDQRALEMRFAIEHERSEAVTRESDETFRLAMSNIASGLFTVDLEGCVTYMNPAAERMLGWTLAELRSKKLHDLTHYLHPDGTPYPAADCPGPQVLQTLIELRNRQDTFIRKDGTMVPFQHIGILSLEFHVDKLSRPLL